MVTNKVTLLVLGVVGAVIGMALVFLVLSGGGGLYAARRAEVFDEPARGFFVFAAVQLAVIPLLGIVACGVFAAARASSPIRRGLMAWGISILTAPLLAVATLARSMVMQTPDASMIFYASLLVVGIVCGGIWVAVARARFGTKSPMSGGDADDRAA